MGTAEQRREQLARMRLYVITGDHGDEVETARIVEAALEGGANVIQLRKKTMPKGEQYAMAVSLRRATLLPPAPVVINDPPQRAPAPHPHAGPPRPADPPTPPRRPIPRFHRPPHRL